MSRWRFARSALLAAAASAACAAPAAFGAPASATASADHDPALRREAAGAELLDAEHGFAAVTAPPEGTEAVADRPERTSATGLDPTSAANRPPAPAPGSPQLEPPADEGTPGPFLGERLRYQNAGFFRRVAADLAAIPLGVTRWDAGDWTWFGLTAGATLGLFLPLHAPLDQRFQNFLAEVAPMPGVWSPANDIVIFGSLLGMALGTLGYGYWKSEDAFVETFSLMAEALVITQIFHISSKLLLSRDGPNTGNGRTIYGPTPGTFERFPEGAPSGHTATLFALSTVISQYWQTPWLSAVLYVASSALATAIVLDRYHYVSDVLWGGSMGIAVGRYVVRHRSTRFQYVDGEPTRKARPVEMAPLVLPTPDGAAAGAVLQGDF